MYENDKISSKSKDLLIMKSGTPVKGIKYLLEDAHNLFNINKFNLKKRFA